MRMVCRLILVAMIGGMSWTSAAGAVDCSAFPKELLDRWGLEKQLVLNLALTGGRNLQSIRESTGAPDPATFRTLADAIETADFSGVKPLEIFDAPEVIAADLRKTADLLEAALAAGAAGGPAWTALAEFYTQKFFVHHNSSIGYWLHEAGCA